MGQRHYPQTKSVSNSGHALLCALGCSLLRVSAASNSAIRETANVIKLMSLINELQGTSRIKMNATVAACQRGLTAAVSGHANLNGHPSLFVTCLRCPMPRGTKSRHSARSESSGNQQSFLDISVLPVILEEVTDVFETPADRLTDVLKEIAETSQREHSGRIGVVDRIIGRGSWE